MNHAEAKARDLQPNKVRKKKEKIKPDGHHFFLFIIQIFFSISSQSGILKKSHFDAIYLHIESNRLIENPNMDRDIFF